VKSLANRLNNTGQDPIINSMLYAAAFSGTSSSKNSNIAQNTSDKKKNKPSALLSIFVKNAYGGK